MKKKLESTAIQESIRELINETRRRGLPVITKRIHFNNNDVPNYLAKLRRYEEHSRETGRDIIVRYAS